MSWKVTIVPRTLHFREPAGTSRGVYLTHDVWYVVLEDKEGRFGVGECAPLPDLSQEAGPDYEERLHEYCRAFAKSGDIYGSVPVSGTRPSAGVKRTSPSTAWCGWAAMTKCSSASTPR